MGKKRNGEIKKCKACDKEYYVPKYRVLSSNFCSIECQNKKQYAGLRANFTCYNCGKYYFKPPSRKNTKSKFCSLKCLSECSDNDYRRRKKQKLSIIKKRGTNNTKVLRKYIFEIKQKQCEICGYNEYDFCLELHHKDKNPTNNTIENIQILCVICHRKLHKGII